MMNKNPLQKGAFLPTVLVFGMTAMILIGILVSLVVYNLRSGVYFSKRATSMQLAEAGINYYQWHLSHDPKDYRDGNTLPENPPYGPYVHDYKNALGEVMGQYTLWIEPPEHDNASVKVTSIGLAQGAQKEVTIEAMLGIPSFSQYAWVTNDQLWFGNGAITNGKVHTNSGVRFDGVANDLVMSAQSVYGFGCTGATVERPGVWGDGTFNRGHRFPVPYIDFTQITADLQNLKTEAQAGGLYLPRSNQSGWRLEIRSNPNQIRVHRVTNANRNRIWTTLVATHDYPSNGIIFVEDDLYISGTINSRMTVAAASLPDPNNDRDRRSVWVIDDIVYHNNTYDGSIILGLIAQQDILIPRYIPLPDLNLDGALLAQNGGIGVDFGAAFGNRDFGTLITHGGMGSDLAMCNGYGMARYRNPNQQGDIEGFSVREYNFDPALMLHPPPMFPTTGTFSILSWRIK